MTKPGWRSVLLREETVTHLEKLKQQREAGRPRKIALGALIEDLIWPVIEGDELLRRYSPFLQEYAIDEDKVVIKDNRTSELAELTLKGGALWCDLDHSDRCVHVGFAWAIPKVYKVMDARGLRAPKVKKE